MSDAPQTEDTMVAALLRERDGLVQRGLDDRVAQVDAQLELRGYTLPKRETAPPETEPPAPQTPATGPEPTAPTAEPEPNPAEAEPEPTATEAEQRSQAPKGRRARATQKA